LGDIEALGGVEETKRLKKKENKNEREEDKD
jgi:hypothetical protein